MYKRNRKLFQETSVPVTVKHKDNYVLYNDLDIITEFKNAEFELNKKIDLALESIADVINITELYCNYELSREDFIVSIAKLGYEYDEIKVSVEDWEGFKHKAKTGIINIITDTLTAIKRVIEKSFLELVNLTKKMLNYVIDRTETIIEIKLQLQQLEKTLEIMVSERTIKYIKNHNGIFLARTLGAYEIEHNILNIADIGSNIDKTLKNFNKLVRDYSNFTDLEELATEISDVPSLSTNGDTIRRDILKHPIVKANNGILVVGINNKTTDVLCINYKKKTPTLELKKIKLDVNSDPLDLNSLKTVEKLIKHIDFLIKQSGEFKTYINRLNVYKKQALNDNNILEKNLIVNIKKELNSNERREEIKKLKLLTHSLDILSTKMIAANVSSYFWNLRTSMRAIEFIAYPYINKK